MSLPHPSDDRTSDTPEPDLPAPSPVDATEAPSVDPESPALSMRPSFEEQLAQSPYASSREFPSIFGPDADPNTVVPPPPASTPIPSPPSATTPQFGASFAPPPYAAAPPPYAAPTTIGPETPVIPPPPPAPYAPGSPTPYSGFGAAPPVYTQQPYSPYPNYSHAEGASSNAVAALICGILGWTFCFPCAIPAAILGFAEVKRIDRGESSRAGRGMALWGGWLGATMCVLGGLVLLVYLAIFIFAIIAAASATSG